MEEERTRASGGSLFEKSDAKTFGKCPCAGIFENTMEQLLFFACGYGESSCGIFARKMNDEVLYDIGSNPWYITGFLH